MGERALQTKRIEHWDILRGFLMFTVILGHLIEAKMNAHRWNHELFLWIYSFHMPMFIFLSGLLQRRLHPHQLKHKVLNYVLLYIWAKILHYISKLFLSESTSFSLFEADSWTWFLLALAAHLVIAYVLQDRQPIFVLLFSIRMAILVGYDLSIDSTFSISRIIVFFPYLFHNFLLQLFVYLAQMIAPFEAWPSVLCYGSLILATLVIMVLLGQELFMKLTHVMTLRAWQDTNRQ